MFVSQSAAAVLMVRPSVFHSNPQTAATNLLQKADATPDGDDLTAARREFDGAVEALDAAGVNVVTADPPPGSPVPDAIFPNNWFSTHADGTVVIYPMLAPNRRLERQPRLIRALDQRFGFTVRKVIDLSHLEEEGEIVEGTGSLVFDHVHRIAYVGLSPRATLQAVKEACSAIGYRECMFVATHAAGSAIYHTNVMLSVGSEVAIACFEAIRNPEQRRRVLEQLRSTGKQLVSLTEAQMMEFGANVLELRGKAGALLAISTRAWAALDPQQKSTLEKHLSIRPIAVDTIERVGGGGLRCMLAEIHLPVRPAIEREALLAKARRRTKLTEKSES